MEKSHPILCELESIAVRRFPLGASVAIDVQRNCPLLTSHHDVIVAVRCNSVVSTLELGRTQLDALTMTPNALKGRGVSINQDGVRRSAFEILAYSEVDFARLSQLWPELADTSGPIQAQLEIEAIYQGYMERQEADIRAFRRDAAMAIPDNLDYDDIPGLSAEVRAKLEVARPATIGSAARISGVTPAATTVLLGYVRRQAKDARRLSA